MNRILRIAPFLAGFCFSAMAQQPTAQPSPILPVVDESMFGAKISRTMTALATSTPNRHNPVRVLFYGQSITAQQWARDIGERLKKEYPEADLAVENRAIGGFDAPLLRRTALEDLYPFYPDLVIFHVYGGINGEYEEIISSIRKETTAEIVIATHHQSHEGNAWVENQHNKESQMIREVAAKYDCELVDVREEWPRYLAENQLHIHELLRDDIHLNPQGCKVMEGLVWRHLRYRPEFANPHADWIKTVPVHPGANGAYNVAFTGNRVDLVASPAGDSRGTARILIDGQPPSVHPKAYTITRPSTAQDVWYPALYTVGWQGVPRVEDWILKLTEVSADAKEFKYTVTGSKTGPDGVGSSAEKFISTSGQVVIDPADFCLARAQAQTKKPCPPDFEIKWSVVPMFKDTYRAPRSKDLAKPVCTTVTQLIENGPHTLEVIPNGDGEVPIQAIRVFQPPLN